MEKVERLKDSKRILIIEQDHNKYSLQIKTNEEYIIFMIPQNEKIYFKKMNLKDLKDTESNSIKCISSYEELADYLKDLSEMKKLLIVVKSDMVLIKFQIEFLFKKHNIEIELFPEDKINIEQINDLENYNIKCKKCNNYPDITIFNTGNRVQIFTECDYKHINISLLDDYIKNIYSYNNKKCAECNSDKDIKICQLCNNYFCEECNNKHLTIDHLINNKIVRLITENKFINIIDNDNKYKELKDKIINGVNYLKEVIVYYKLIRKLF